MATDEFISDKDTDALAEMTVFGNGLAASPATYGVTAGDAAAVNAAVGAFGTALAVTQNPATRTTVTVATKDYTRISAEQICRQFYNLIKPNSGISDEAKIAIGVKPPTTVRNPIPVPTSSPILSFIGSTPDGAHTLRFSDTETPDSRAKPFGAASMQLWRVIGPAGVLNPEGAQFYGLFTKNPISSGFAPADNSKVVTYFGRWCTARGEVGPWGAALSRPIAATNALAA
jgi:hypothetical protein